MRARVLLPILALLVVAALAFLLQHLLTKDTLARERDRKSIGPDTLRLEVGGNHPHLRLPETR
ncbi:MAG: hypothetical protein KDC95_14175 [Planctomycetes bacterium]|nr:hypothetical protein [Planctomycetota bacterium]